MNRNIIFIIPAARLGIAGFPPVHLPLQTLR